MKHSTGAREKSQLRRFKKAAHKAGASNDERVFDKNLKRTVKAKPKAGLKDG